MTHPNLSIKAVADGELELVIYDAIGSFWGEGISAKHVSALLKDHRNASTIHVRLNSPGGNAYDGIAIYNLLKQHEARVVVHVDALAASAASLVAMSGDEIVMSANALLMMHEAQALAAGTATDLRDKAEMLDKVGLSAAKTYASRSGKTVDDVLSLMADETWFTADEAVEAGFADSVVDALDVAACLRPEHLEHYHNAPKALLSERQPSPPPFPVAAMGDPSSAPRGAIIPQPATEPPHREAPMWKSLFIALAISQDADEATAVAAITKLKAQAELSAELEAITGKRGPEAIGAVRAMADAATERDKLRTELDKREGDQARADFQALLKGAQEGDEKKLTPAMAKFWQDRFDGGTDKAKLCSELRGYLDVAAPVLPKNLEQPGGSTGSATVTHDGKCWSDIKPAARASLRRENPELYNAMREDAKRRGLIV